MAIKKKATYKKRKEMIFEFPFRRKIFKNKDSYLWINSVVGERRYGGYVSSSHSINVSTCTSSHDRESISININYDDTFDQQGGSLQLGCQEARWLAKTILAAVNSI